MSHTSFRALLELPPGALSFLKSLSVTLDSGETNHSTHRLESALQGLPNLREVHIHGYCPIMSYFPHFPLSQLTNLGLRCGNVTPNVMHYTLQHCSSLLEAQFEITEKGITDISNRQPAELVVSNLTSLEITLNSTVDWDLLLSPLVLPSLDTFDSIGYPSPNFEHALSALIVRSKCSLHSLSLEIDEELEWETPHPEITQLLEETPELTSFSSCYIAPPALIRTVHGELLPCLTDVNWKVTPEGLFTLLDLLDAHIAQGCPPPNFGGLIYVTCLDGGWFEDARARYCNSYNMYKDAGLDFSIHNENGNDLRSFSGGYVAFV